MSFETELQETKERTQPWGADPNGSLVFGADERMMVLLTAKVREPGNTDEKLAALFRTIVAYTGRYRVEDDRFITKVDASWNEAWTGMEQERVYTLNGDKLEVRTSWMPNSLVYEHAVGRGVHGFRRE